MADLGEDLGQEDSDTSSLDLNLSCSFSSFNNDSDSMEDSSSVEEILGLEPYQYEPEEPPHTENSNSPLIDSLSSNENSDDRLHGTDWCKCGNCDVMGTVDECVCCLEIESVMKKLGENCTEIGCITDHEGFESVCLNLWVLQTAFHQYRQSHGSQIPLVEDDEKHKKYRFIAYRQLIWWCWGWLGKKIRVCLPSCAVLKIRQKFPSSTTDYTGFKYPKLGEQ